MKTKWNRLMRWTCGKIGHSFSDFDVFIFLIKTNEINGPMYGYDARLVCRRCGAEFCHKNAKEADQLTARR